MDEMTSAVSGRGRALRRASWVGILGNGFLAAVKIAGGFAAGSLAVVGDGIDSASDILGSLITLIASRIMEEPPDREHPYGHLRAETLATKILSFLIFFAGIQLFLSAGRSLLSGEPPAMPGILGVYVTGISLAGKALLAGYKFRVGRRLESSMMTADAKNMRGDVVMSGTVLAGLGLTYWLGIPWLDRALALGVGLWIMRVGIDLFRETTRELMDGVEDPGLYSRVFQAVEGVPGAERPHRSRIRRIANYLVMDLDIEVDPEITVREGHRIASEVEGEIRRRVENVYDIMIHVEPRGNVEEAEKFGVAPGDGGGTGCGGSSSGA